MKTIDWTAPADSDERVMQFPRAGTPLTYSAERVLVGDCPDCQAVLIVFNDRESWPMVGCACGWKGDIQSVTGTLYERACAPRRV